MTCPNSVFPAIALSMAETIFDTAPVRSAATPLFSLLLTTVIVI